MFVNACRKESIDIQEENTKCLYNYKLSEVFNLTHAYSYTVQGYLVSLWYIFNTCYMYTDQYISYI